MHNALPSLNEIGLEFGTDKSSAHHGYLDFYESFFSPLRFQKPTILEIGVYGGASVKTWETYFPDGAIIGADIDPATAQFASSRISIEIMDQSNVQDLVDVAMKHGPFDIIIEDGSHQWEHQITSLRTLFPFVKNGGLYIVEDLQTNYGNFEGGYRGVASHSCMDYLKRLTDLRVGDEAINIAAEEDAFLRTYASSIKFITFFRHACLLQKNHQNQRFKFSNTPLATPDKSEIARRLSLICHLGHHGDTIGNQGLFINSTGSNGVYIQGFAIAAAAGSQIDLSYRARRQDGTWTDWMGSGEFAGSRQQSQNLTGFAVRLPPGLKSKFTLKVLGCFEDEDTIQEAGDGEDCVSPNSLKWLKGMQLLFEPRGPAPA